MWNFGEIEGERREGERRGKEDKRKSLEGTRGEKGWFKMERAANRSLRLFVRELL